METPTRRLPPGMILEPGNNAIKLYMLHTRNGWEVAYPVIPDHEEQAQGSNYSFGPTPYKPGQMVQWVSIPLMEYLNMLADEYKLPHVLVATI